MAELFALEDAVGSHYKPPAKRDLRKPLSAKLPGSLVAGIEQVVRLWTARAKAEGEDPAEIKKIGFTYVLERFVRNGIDDEWKLFGGLAGISEKPTTDEQWGALVDAVIKHYRNTKSEQKK